MEISMDFDFKDYRDAVRENLDALDTRFLTEAGAELLSQTQKNQRVATGGTKGGWRSKVDAANKVAYVGNGLENSIWEEFGTGEYALDGTGRKTPWVYKNPLTGKFYRTKGKKPCRALYRAMNFKKSAIKGIAEAVYGGG